MLCFLAEILVLLIGLFLFPAAAPAQALELEGKTEFIDVLVKNFYQGVLVDVLKKNGDAVQENDVLGHYRLDSQEIEAIRTALDESDLRKIAAQINDLDGQIRNQNQKVAKLNDSVRAGYENPLRLDSELAELDLLQVRLQELQKDKGDLTAHLANERARISENLQGLKVSRDHVPAVIPLLAPIEGMISSSPISPGAKLAAKSECFRVASRTFLIKTRVYAEEYGRLKVGDTATVSIQGFSDTAFPAKLLLLPRKPVDKGSMALSYYEVFFRVEAPGLHIREGLSARVTVP